ncbi:hypothetical protein D9M68_785380 [compost metagenome]
MTNDELLWVIGLTALLTAPAAILLYLLWDRVGVWFRRLLPPRHLVRRGLRVTRNAEEGRPNE